MTLVNAHTGIIEKVLPRLQMNEWIEKNKVDLTKHNWLRPTKPGDIASYEARKERERKEWEKRNQQS